MIVERPQEYNVTFDDNEIRTFQACIRVLVDCRETMKELKCTSLYTSDESLNTIIVYEEILDAINMIDSFINEIDKMS